MDEIKKRHATGQPVLVGTVAIESSERLSQGISKNGYNLDHPVYQNDHEAGYQYDEIRVFPYR